LCSIATGRSFSATEDYAKVGVVPEGYDSFCIDFASSNTDKLDIEKELNMNSNLYHYEYFVKDPSQILPRFFVEFEYDEEAEKKSRLVREFHLEIDL
jgi:hypothetical protein